MKVKEIYIKDFRQFKDFKLDLTYPKGHPKEYKPLDKVCFIGQSGTGKTSLLKLLYLIRMPGDFKEKLNANTEELIDKIAFRLTSSKNEDLVMSFKDSQNDLYALSENMMTVFNLGNSNYEDIFKDNLSGTVEYALKIAKTFEIDKSEKLIYFPSNLKYDFKKEQKTKSNPSRKLFDFSKDSIYELWDLIIEDVTKYQEQELKIRQQISIAAETGDTSAIQEEVIKLKEWEVNNFNPVNDLADNCIDSLIKHFSLRVKKDLDIQQKEDIGFIKIENYNGVEVPYISWSTGTKQVILSALPLYLLKPKNSTILFDEPETSLYPDLQRIIIDYYQGLTTDSQFFYATHSPIIASSFEPWEIVELKFNDSGHVYRELYFEGENHVDNYYIDPRFLNFDLMLKEVFDMKYTNGDMRYEALSKYGMLKNQLDTLKKEDKLQTPEAKNIYKEFKSLSKKLAVNPE
jgi:predicted ATP-dependent endonuclease of OLD family